MANEETVARKGAENKEFLERLLDTFRVEAEEHLRTLYSSLETLRETLRNSSDQKGTEPLVETIYREAHSLKGAARAVNLIEIEQICQTLETNLASKKNGTDPISLEWIDLQTSIIDLIKDLLLSVNSPHEMARKKASTTQLLRHIEVGTEGAAKKASPVELKSASPSGPDDQPILEPRPAQVPGTVSTTRIPTSRLDTFFFQTEEMLSTKLQSKQIASDIVSLNGMVSDRMKDWIKTPLETRDLFEQIQARLLLLEKSIEHHQRTLTEMLDRLSEDVRALLMLPFSSVLEVLPRVVRDLARDQNKKVEIKIQGGELEVDKRILDELKDPMIHLVRNCVDHGIENPEIRKNKGKPPLGQIQVRILQKELDRVEILVADDGAGIDSTQVRAAALKMGFPPSKIEALDEKGIESLIFHSGLSTRSIITDLSGRGLGLAIVREKIEKLGGNVSIEGRKDRGTTIRLISPFTLATFRGLIIRVGGDPFVVPVTSIEQALKIKKEAIITMEGHETFHFRGQFVLVVEMGAVLGLSKTTLEKPDLGSSGEIQVVLLTSSEQKIAFKVDEILHVQEIVVKRLGPQLTRVRNISGCTILGTREVVPILNPNDLMRSAVAMDIGLAQVPAEIEGEKVRSILIVEDSITSRSLLKNVLETAGYRIKTAVDGVDALAKLRTGPFDGVVTDVDMPRMNGFALTKAIRSEKSLKDLPVVLITALESNADRERGIEAGANAYIVKRGFDQSNLLEIVRRLL